MTFGQLRMQRFGTRVGKSKYMLGRFAILAAAFLIGSSVSAASGATAPKKSVQLTTARVDIDRDGRMDTISVLMTAGRRFRDTEAWCGGGGLEKFEGRFEFSVRLGSRSPVFTSMNDLFGGGDLWLSAHPWKLQFADFNHDGILDFTTGQHGGCSGWFYRVLTVEPSGEVRSFAAYPRSEIWSMDRANSSALFHVTPSGFRVSQPGRSAQEVVCAEYSWQGSEGFRLVSEQPTLCPEDDEGSQAP